MMNCQVDCWFRSYTDCSRSLYCSSTNETPHTKYKKLSYRRDSARCVKRPFKVTQGHLLLCQSTCHIGCDFLLALNSNLTSIFNRSWYITPSLHIHTPPLFQVELCKKTAGSGHALVSGCPNIGLFNHEHKSAQSAPYDHNARPCQTDGQTDEHHGNSATIRSTNASRANNVRKALIQGTVRIMR